MPSDSSTGDSNRVKYRLNGHEFAVREDYDGDVIVECRKCLIRELVQADDDPQDRLELLTPECHIEWLRQPDGGFRGVALRSASGFSGRELIAVGSDGEVTDTVRVYDEDAPLLASLLDRHEWEVIRDV